jgi:Protein of unknown function (DUF2971)
MKWDTYQTKGITSKYLYRYVSLTKLLHFLRTGSLYFTRMDSFEDGLEGIIPYNISELYVNLPELPDEENRNKAIISKEMWEADKERRLNILNAIQHDLLEKQKNLYVNCWYLGDSESLGMWDLYGKNGFMIRFERQVIQDLVKSEIKSQTVKYESHDLLVGGIIRYQDFDKVPWNEEDSLIKYSGFRKHIAFKHEEEYRFIIHKSEITAGGIEYKLGEINDLQFDLFANPKMNPFEFSTNNELISRYTNKELNESKLKPWLDFKNMKF